MDVLNIVGTFAAAVFNNRKHLDFSFTLLMLGACACCVQGLSFDMNAIWDNETCIQLANSFLSLTEHPPGKIF